MAASEAVLVYVRVISVRDAPQPLPMKQLIDFARSPVLEPSSVIPDAYRTACPAALLSHFGHGNLVKMGK